MINHFAWDSSLNQFCQHISSCPIGRVVKGVCYNARGPGIPPQLGKPTVLYFEHRGLFVGFLTFKMQNLHEIEKKLNC